MDLAIAVDAQGKATDKIGPGIGEFFRGGAVGDEITQRFQGDIERFLCLVLARLHADHERTFLRQRREIAAARIRQPALLAHFFVDARGESTAAEHVVADEQGKIIRVAARDADAADEDMALRGVMRNQARHLLGLGLDRRQQRGCALRRRQAGGNAFGDGVGLGARHITHDRDHGIARDIMPPVKRGQIVAGDFGDRFHFAGTAQSIRVRAIHEAVKRERRDGARLDIGFLDRTDEPRFFTRQRRRRKQRLVQDAREHVQSLLALGAARQRAHGEARAIAIETPADAGADIRGAARDLVFIHALGAQTHDAIGHARHAGFIRAVKAGAASNIYGQVEHRDVAVFDEIHLRAARRLPMLDRQDRQRQLWRQQKYQ